MDGGMETPCIKVCVIGDADGLCLGCGRSLDEIAAWGNLEAGERRQIMRVLAERMADRKPLGEAGASTVDRGASRGGKQ